MKQYDSIVIGAGHNGLVCASYLARAGQRVVVLEAGDQPGGLAADREFHPGFNVSVAHSVSHFSSRVIDDLNIGEFASAPMPLVGLRRSGEHISIDGENISGVGEQDHEAYARYVDMMQEFELALEPFWTRTMPRIGAGSLGDMMTFAKLGLNLRRMGREPMREFMRVASLPARDLVDEYFEDPELKALLCWDGLIGCRMAPRSPNSAVLAMLYRKTASKAGAHQMMPGGSGGLVSALQSAAAAAGVEIRCGASVERILVDEGTDGLKANGVELAGGGKLNADRVISSADPRRTFVSMLGVDYLDIGFTNRIRRLRCDGNVAKLHLALEGVPRFNGLDEGRGRIVIAPEMDAIEFAWDDAKYGLPSENPVMEIVVPSLDDDSVAPAGQHVLSAHVMYIPYAHRNGWSEEAKAACGNSIVAELEKYAPGIREQIIHSELLTPADLEREYRVTGGHWHHTEFAMDQMLMMRPTYEAAQYRTPVPGLYLCGAGCHPAGDLVGAAGHNAAMEILR